MKSEKLYPSRSNILKATKIEVFGSLSEKFGHTLNIPSKNADKEQTMHFQLDRLFTIIHDN